MAGSLHPRSGSLLERESQTVRMKSCVSDESTSRPDRSLCDRARNLYLLFKNYSVSTPDNFREDTCRLTQPKTRRLLLCIHSVKYISVENIGDTVERKLQRELRFLFTHLENLKTNSN